MAASRRAVQGLVIPPERQSTRVAQKQTVLPQQDKIASLQPLTKTRQARAAIEDDNDFVQQFVEEDYDEEDEYSSDDDGTTFKTCGDGDWEIL